MGNITEFERAVYWLSDNLAFDVDVRVNLFEVSLLKAFSTLRVWLNSFAYDIHCLHFSLVASSRSDIDHRFSQSDLIFLFFLHFYCAVQHKSSWRTCFCSYSCNWFYKQVGSKSLQKRAAQPGSRFRAKISSGIWYTHWIAICMG